MVGQWFLEGILGLGILGSEGGLEMIGKFGMC
jgi:hypothetical protein